MSDGSFPDTHPDESDDDHPSPEEPEGGRVLGFPDDEVATGGLGPPSVVPAGTWADDEGEPPVHLLRPATGEPADRSPRSALEGGEIVEFPPRPGTHRRRRPRVPGSGDPAQSPLRRKDASGTRPTQVPSPAEPPVLESEEVPRPAYLASELLKQDWWPRAPLCRTLRWGSIALGLFGIALALGLGGGGSHALGMAALFTACTLVGATPLSPNVRGMALAIVGIGGAAWGAWELAVESQSLDTPLLVGCVILSSSALFFRAAHRTSRLARVLAAIGLLATASWLVLTGGIDAMVIESLSWQAWIDPASRFLLGMVALLAVLSFLDPTGHGGAWVAGSALLGWLTLHSTAALVVRVFPMRAPPPGIEWDAEPWMALRTLPLFCAVAAGGLCQLWVLLSNHTRRPRTDRSSAQSRPFHGTGRGQAASRMTRQS